jgi:hypothetical protein
MLVRLRKSFRTRGQTLNPKTFAFFFVESKRDELIALRGRHTDMSYCSSVCCLFFLSCLPRICWGDGKEAEILKAGGDRLVEREEEKAWFELLGSRQADLYFRICE